MKPLDTQIAVNAKRRLDCYVTYDQIQIKAAQRLRFKVFAQEMGAHLKTEAEGLDYDEIDDYCDHLIVVDTVDDSIVGYTRLLNQKQAQRLGRFYSQSEFNLDRVLAMPGRFLEIGRTCVDPKSRGSAVLTTLWSGLVKYAQAGRYDFLIGCASISPGPSGFAVDAIGRSIEPKNRGAESLKVAPTKEVPMHLRCERDESGIPPLLKAYLRFGVQICGQPYWDEDFNVMDLFILLSLSQLEERYTKHYFKPQTLGKDVHA
ncbi:MAG: hemolysin [Gammaproteobacteria bacterium HGW-Gammaproteobacteria-10]|nr:MAG: hemolysin [Gammaproteobacteria bacterium HGW-Gammaproteobacteria-3]PKM35234.1 MAG: hemolysin [Gammaproteobacteria bacterium HGW-Gammaproteobacteria-10]